MEDPKSGLGVFKGAVTDDVYDSNDDLLKYTFNYAVTLINKVSLTDNFWHRKISRRLFKKNNF